MKMLSNFVVLNIEGGDRITFTFNETNDSGDIISTNNKKSFFAVDPTLSDHIKAVWEYIEENKLEG